MSANRHRGPGNANANHRAGPDGRRWQQVTLRNKSGMTVTVADWGATLLSAEVPLADGSLRRPLLGCAKLEDYARQAAFLGASGRPLRQPYRPQPLPA